MIDLYTAPTPNGRKISILLEELGLPYTVHAVDLAANEQFEPTFLAISPNNKIPAIVDHDEGVRLMESGAIMLHLAERAGQLMATERKARLEILQWLFWQTSGFGPILGQAHQYLHYHRGKALFAEDRFRAEVRRLYGVLDRQLDVAGDYSVAVVAIWHSVARFAWHEIELADYRHVRRWYLQIAERPAVRHGYQVPYREAVPIPR